MQKQCTICLKIKLISKFASKVRNTGKRWYSLQCRDCIYRRYRLKHPEIIRINQSKYDKKRRITTFPKKRLALFKHIGQTSCKRCGNNDLRVLQFHHRDPSQKTKHGLYLNLHIDRLKREVEKCDVLCANCHIITHHEIRYNGI